MLEIPRIHWTCLQKDVPERDHVAVDNCQLLDRVSLSDFSVTAEQISALDLVISVDTAVAHLAGAMGRPVWTLLKFAPDWRWLLGREDSPWYPTMRLFRQETAGDWRQPVARVQASLSALAARRAPA